MIKDETVPRMLGTELAAAVLSSFRETLAILMSGNVGPQLERHASEAKVDELLRKPLALGDLAECMSHVLAKARLNCARSACET